MFTDAADSISTLTSSRRSWHHHTATTTFDDVGRGCFPAPPLRPLRRCGPWSTRFSVMQDLFWYEPLISPLLAITNPPDLQLRGTCRCRCGCYLTALYGDMARIAV